MKSAKRRSNKGRGGSVPSVLNYFSKSKRKKASKSQTAPSFGTPATPMAHPADDESETPVSAVSDDAVLAELSRKSNPVCGSEDGKRRTEGERQDTPDSSTPMSSSTPEPNTPPSPAPGSCVPIYPGGMMESGGSAMTSAQTSETPPSNDTYMTTPPSPPTPLGTPWRDCPADQTENNPNNAKRNQPRSYGESTDAKEEDVRTPKSLLETNESPAQNDSQRQPNVNMGTPSTARTPSTSASTLPQSNNFFRKYAASTSSKSLKARKMMDQNALFFKPIKKQKQSSNQLFLDFGQNTFGKQTICNICGMLRVLGMEEDDAQHAKICKEYKEGVMCVGWKNERSVVILGKDNRILEVRPEDAQQYHKKVSEVKTIVDKELGFASRKNEDPSDAVSNLTSYMYICKKRVVGLLMVKQIQRAYELLPGKEGDDTNSNNGNNGNNSSSISRSLNSSKALLGVHQIWVHNSHRSRGIASHLVTAARDHLIFGMLVPLELVAFSSPTDEGLRFAKRYTGSEKPLIYDIH